MIELIIISIALMITAFFKSERDKISFRPTDTLIKTNYWLKRNWLKNKIGSLKGIKKFTVETVLSFIIDGWHTSESTIYITYSFIISVLLSKLYTDCFFTWHTLWITLGLYIISGIFFEIFWRIKWKF